VKKQSKHTERNKNIAVDYKTMTPKALVEKYGLQFEYLQKIATKHNFNKQAKKKEVLTGVRLYADRDMAAIKYFSQIGA
jgi:hypothetical protein